GMVALGALNHYRLVPAMQSASDARRLAAARRLCISVQLETVLLLIVLGVTAVLLGAMPPHGWGYGCGPASLRQQLDHRPTPTMAPVLAKACGSLPASDPVRRTGRGWRLFIRRQASTSFDKVAGLPVEASLLAKQRLIGAGPKYAVCACPRIVKATAAIESVSSWG